MGVRIDKGDIIHVYDDGGFVLRSKVLKVSRNAEDSSQIDIMVD